MKKLFQTVWYHLIHAASWAVIFVFYGFRAEGRKNMPSTGGGLVCANHQSYFDPVVVGVSSSRQMSFVARSTLFNVPIFDKLIHSLGAIPINRDKGGLAGLKATIRLLKGGKLVLIFPEGTRTDDGELQPLKPGFCALVRRCKVPIIPVGFDGPFQAWPRESRWPRLGAMRSCVGKPITPEEIGEMDDDQLIALVAERIAECFQKARAARLRALGQE